MKACNTQILKLFYEAKHTGRIVKPEAIARIGNDDEGLVIELTWRVSEGVIKDAKFRAFGNPNVIAIASLMTGSLVEKSVEDALNIGEEVIIENLGEFRPEYVEVYDIMREAIVEAYNNYLKRKNRRDYEEREYVERDGEEIDVAKLIQRELQGERVERRGRPRKEKPETEQLVVGEKRGRGRPRKIVDETTINEVETIKRGRGRPRKIVDESEVVEPIGERRGRGRPRKERPEGEEIETVKRGRGRPRKEVSETEIVEVGEKRGRGRPRKEVSETEQNGVETIKRGRGRPRKVVDESELTLVEGEKRGRGRPRKVVDENEVVEIGEKRGRGRPRKVVDETEQDGVETIKRGRGRPRKEVDENQIIEVGVKRGRGRPKKISQEGEMDDTIYFIEVDEKQTLLSQNTVAEQQKDVSEEIIEMEDQTAEVENIVAEEVEISPAEEIKEEVDILNSIASTSEDDDEFGDYDLFKSNIRNILSGKEVSSKHYHEVGQADSAKEVKLEHKTEASKVEENEELSEKRGRGRPKKIVVEEVEHEKRGRGRPRVEPASSITRSLTPNSLPNHSSQEILFASKNVTTTNININVTKTTSSVDENNQVNYSHNTNISSKEHKVELSVPTYSSVEKDEEIEVEAEPKTQSSNLGLGGVKSSYSEVDDEIADIDASKIKDEAPKGGIEDLLRALLED